MRWVELIGRTSLAVGCGLVLLGGGTGLAQDGPADAVVVQTLRSAVAQARRSNLELRAQEFEITEARLEIDKVFRQGRLPALDLDFKTGLVPEARGDIFSSPDRAEDLDGWGPFYQLELGLVQPVFTFGKTSSATRAARHGLTVVESARTVVAEDLTFNVVKTYWALLSAQRGLELARRLRTDYDELVARVREELENPDADIDDTDLLEVRVLEYEVDKTYQESLTLMETTRRQLAVLVGAEAGARLLAVDLVTPELLVSDASLSALTAEAADANPRLRQVRAGLSALDARIDLTQARQYPDVYFAGGFRWGIAGNRADQMNPFVVDNFNYRSLGGFVGVRWDLDFLGRRIEVQQNRAGRSALERRRDLLEDRLGAEVAEVFAEAQSAFELLRSARASVDAARTWLRLSFDNWDLGIGEVERLLEAHQAFYRYRGVEIEQEYRYNEALARLARATGDADRYLDWVEAGRVTLE